MRGLYPFKFQPIFKDKIWGGNKIRTVLGKDYGDLPNCGETWELSGVKGNVSSVANGPLAGTDLNQLIRQLGADLLGEKVLKEYGQEFPLLVKFIDANDDLSIQVHPDDQIAAAKHGSKGKTEMWYVVQADEGSSLISGFNQELTRTEYLQIFNQGKLTDVLNREQVSSGDVFFIPAGRVHTIGKGLLIAEIQQTSDITYRIYDFDRADAQGQKRELHIEQALDAIDFRKYPAYKSSYPRDTNSRVQVAHCQYFTTNKLELTQTFDLAIPGLDSFRIYTCVEGSGTLLSDGQSERISAGEVVLIPAALEDLSVETESDLVLLESYIQ